MVRIEYYDPDLTANSRSGVSAPPRRTEVVAVLPAYLTEAI